MSKMVCRDRCNKIKVNEEIQVMGKYSSEKKEKVRAAPNIYASNPSATREVSYTFGCAS